MSRRTDSKANGATSPLIWALRLLVLGAVLTCVFAAALMLFARWQQARLAGAVTVDGGVASLNPLERVYLQSYLAANADLLAQPVNITDDAVLFTITPGQNANQIADNLQMVGVISDAGLFRAYLRYYGLDARLEAGEYRLQAGLTLPELALTLTQSYAQDVTVRLLEGWRLAEMARYLQRTQPASVDASMFQILAETRAAAAVQDFAFLASVPPGASLEGFLFPDTYRLPLDADAEDLIQLMLQTFDERVTPAMRQAFGVQGLTVYEAVTLASILEREAVIPEEQPLMAGVFLNRLRQGMKLQADPTVQYALGFQTDAASWWKSPLTAADLSVQSPYNTYVFAGLPPGPISNPGLSALQAVAEPAPTDFLYFVVDCTAARQGAHTFSETYEEHLAKVQRCR
ncbi:MAG: endolytic transglycosylase MltG [Candidatus Promineifilaceae bacterium]|nr:endolytic transglycosylase MltG [Candidatus Promineifilaceae bacterium]